MSSHRDREVVALDIRSSHSVTGIALASAPSAETREVPPAKRFANRHGRSPVAGVFE